METHARPRPVAVLIATALALALAVPTFAQDDAPTPIDLPARRPAPATQPAVTPTPPAAAAPVAEPPAATPANAPTADATSAAGSTAPTRPVPAAPPALVPPPDAPPAPAHDDGETLWPQQATVDGVTYVLYAPQFETLDPSRATARCAFSMADAGKSPTFGTFSFDARVDHDGPSGAIVLSGIEVQRATLADGRNADAAATELQSMISGARFTANRAGVMRNMQVAKRHASTQARLSRDVPEIRVVQRRATLLLLDGAPVLRPVGDGSMGLAQNTASLLAFDRESRTWFTRLADGTWMHSAAFRGPYASGRTPTPDQRAAIESALPKRNERGDTAPPGDGRTATATADGAGPRTAPDVIVSTRPLCLVSIDGSPRTVAVADGVRAVANAGCDLFTNDAQDRWWLLASGRWFTTADLMAGPWASVPVAELPEAFASIDPHGPWGNVLASVPGTPQAVNALYQQQIVHLATLERATAHGKVSFLGGTPRLRPIEGTSMRYATNASDPLVACDGRWYLCQGGAWFVADAATGPWSPCDALPEAIGSIPPTCPVYPATFVEVAGSTPDTVTYAFTAGAMNSYVQDGTVVWGTGYATPGATDQGDVPSTDDVIDPTWGPYAGWPITYGYWPSYGCEFGAWNFSPFPGWADAGLWCGAPWCGSGWWGPGWECCTGYALGLGFAGAWDWGYHPWGWRDGSGWWNNHWQGTARRTWDHAMTDANAAARAGVHGTLGAGARAEAKGAAGAIASGNGARWAHAAGVANDVYAGRNGQVTQRRAEGTYRRTDGAWQRDPEGGARGGAAEPRDAEATLVERDPGTDAHAVTRDGGVDAGFRPDPNHNYDGSPRGAFARGETNYVDRGDAGMNPAQAPASANQGQRTGSWNGGGWERGGWGVSDQYGTYAQRWGNDYDRGIPGFNQDTGWYDRTVSRPVNPYGYNYAGWSNGYRGYGSLSGWTGARGGWGTMGGFGGMRGGMGGHR